MYASIMHSEQRIRANLARRDGHTPTTRDTIECRRVQKGKLPQGKRLTPEEIESLAGIHGLIGAVKSGFNLLMGQ